MASEEELGSLLVTIGIDGSGFQNGVSIINRQQRLLQSEFKVSQAALGSFASETDKLKLQSEMLGKQIGLQKDKVTVLQTAYERMIEAKGADARATQELAIKLNQARASLSGMQNALQQTTNEIQQQSSALGKLRADFNSAFGQSQMTVFDASQQIGLALTGIGAAGAAGLGAAVNSSMDFGAQMSKVQALASASTDEFEKLKAKAIELGGSTSFSASQSAAGMQMLAAAGMSANQIIDAMPGVLSAAAASGEEMSLVAETMSTALNSFGLEASQAGHVADVLAASANSSSIGVEDMAYTLKYAAPVAKSLGISLEEVAAAAIEMGNAGIKGEQAGTTLRAAFLRLVDPPKEASDKLKELGVSILDANGKMRPMGDIIGQLNSGLSGMSEANQAAALSTVFGTEAVSGLMVMVGKGKEQFDQYTQAMENSTGSAKATADVMQNNLKGTVDQFTGAMESAAIVIGDALTPAIRLITQMLTGMVDSFNKLSPGMQTAIAVSAAVGTALALISGPILLLIGFIPMITAGFAALAPVWAALGGAFAAITAPVGIAIGAIALLSAAAIAVYKNWDEITAFLTKTWTTLTTSLSATWDGVKTYFSNLWDGIKLSVVSAWQGVKDALAAAWDSIQPVFNVITAFFTGWWSSIWTVANAYVETVTAVFSALWESVKVIFATALLVVYNLVTGRWDEVGTVFASAGEKLRGIVGDLWENIKGIWTAAFAEVWKRTQAALAQLDQFFVEAMAGLKGIWNSAVTTIKSAWNGLWESVKTAAASGWQSVYNFFATAPARIAASMSDLRQRIQSAWEDMKTSAVQAGKDFLTGFVNGVMDMAGWVRGKIAGFFGDVVGWAKEVLDIHSPSRVMQEVGQWTMEGFVVGMEDKESRAYKVVEAIGEGVQKALSSINLDMDITNTEYQIAMAVNGIDEVERLNTQLELLELSLNASDDRLAVLNKGYNDSAAILGMYADESEKLYLEILKEQQAQLDLKKQVTQAIGDSAQRALSAINLDMSITDLEYEIAMSATGVAEVERLKLEVESLNLAIGASDDRLATLNKAYNDTVYLLGENAEESKKLYIEILKEQKIRADLKKQVDQTNRSIIDQQEQMSKAQKQVAEETKRYLDEMGKAQDDYEKKCQAARDSEAEGIRKLNEEYDKAFEARRSSLVNFVGLFDKVQNKNVDGSQLLDNLRGQVDTFVDWQKNLDGLKNRKIDADLLGELTQMGPKSAAEIAALNGLSDADLQEYVRLWKEKNKLASQQATAELSGMKEETRKKIDELKKVTAAKLDEIRAEWKSKNEKIRADTVANFDKMKQDAQKFGGDFISKITTSINESMPMLEQTLADIRSKIKSALSVDASVGMIGGAVGAAINVPGLATGGTITRAGLTLVGEQGPELLNLPRGSSVVPLDGSVGGLGGTTIEIHVNGTVYGVDDLQGLMTQAIQRTPLAPILDNQHRQTARKNY
ncbi:phage tail tape measure protein [Tumebacillus sp. DT12]|uniref:Phage tail tape measure protein n=1 Tax=Tumebacillus lacus TaxID=2995335 RepID=A0ABT3X0H7_9BACL|nr:phage tail tape measure protein [Tumebacillus lacus]MCX7570414.1 phage tail tape measure protein [Tumebacillus lacus]